MKKYFDNEEQIIHEISIDGTGPEIIRGPFHKSLYKRYLPYEFIEPVLNYRSHEFIALTNLYEMGPRPVCLHNKTMGCHFMHTFILT